MHRTEVDFLYDLLETVAGSYGRRDAPTDASSLPTDERDEEAVVAMAGALADAARSDAGGTDSGRSG